MLLYDVEGKCVKVNNTKWTLSTASSMGTESEVPKKNFLNPKQFGKYFCHMPWQMQRLAEAEVARLPRFLDL